MTDEHRLIDEQRQRLSALQDGELDPASAARLLDALAEDASLRKTWERHHLIGLAIRGEHFAHEHRMIADRVRESLALEPLRIVPRRRERPTRLQSSSLVGMALAASVVFLAIFVAPTLWQEAAIRSSGATQATPLASREPLPDRMNGRWQLDRPDLASKLDQFLVTHQETAPATGAKGMLRYATFVGYELPR
ncbi:sigma-E factor negative regulatory protein [uncultured Thiocystis sp.]|jgi:sigma-E factor negative regulatory protein RseA|uniref:sigma-E factor negative regulatory protein n=1 Tax=uncultured Thiocystis sp. TaxID=1202134 RepID=UPI0025DAE2BB|nr:sigma-E factor negative regulatory protein [uncultured Thiocystis sp.]